MIYNGGNISFRTGKKVDCGGNGVIYRIFDHKEKEELVVKFLKNNHKKKTLQRFKQEIIAVKDLYAASGEEYYQ